MMSNSYTKYYFFSITLEIYVDGLSLSNIVSPVISFAFLDGTTRLTKYPKTKATTNEMIDT